MKEHYYLPDLDDGTPLGKKYEALTDDLITQDARVTDMARTNISATCADQKKYDTDAEDFSQITEMHMPLDILDLYIDKRLHYESLPPLHQLAKQFLPVAEIGTHIDQKHQIACLEYCRDHPQLAVSLQALFLYIFEYFSEHQDQLVNWNMSEHAASLQDYKRLWLPDNIFTLYLPTMVEVMRQGTDTPTFDDANQDAITETLKVLKQREKFHGTKQVNGKEVLYWCPAVKFLNTMLIERQMLRKVIDKVRELQGHTFQRELQRSLATVSELSAEQLPIVQSGDQDALIAYAAKPPFNREIDIEDNLE